MFNKDLLNILVCPLCKGSLQYQLQPEELICEHDQMAYPIKEDIPILLEREARSLK